MQRAFALHLTEGELSHRLDIDVSTLRRWFERVGKMRPAQFMQFVRLHAFAIRLARGKESVEHVSDALGFSSSAHLRRTLARTVNMSPRALRNPDGIALFEHRMIAELREPYQNRA